MGNYFPTLEPVEVAALRDLLRKMRDAAPDGDSWQLPGPGGPFDEEDCRLGLRDLAIADNAKILRAVRGYFHKRCWPSMSTRSRYFLGEVLDSASAYCGDWLRAYSSMATLPLGGLPEDALLCVELLVTQHWADTGRSIWVERNLT